MSDLVTCEIRDDVATITMDDGKANALTPQMFELLGAALDKTEAGAAVTVLQGRQGRFSGGFDLRTLMAGGEGARSLVRTGFELAARIHDFPTPVVAVSTGHAVAMGVFLLMAADYRLGVTGPFTITCNEVKIGLTMPEAALELCRARLTPSDFWRAMTLSASYDPSQAVAAGFYDRVVPVEDLDGTITEVVANLVQLNRSAYLSTKRRVRGSISRALREAIKRDDEALASMLSSAPT